MVLSSGAYCVVGLRICCVSSTALPRVTLWTLNAEAAAGGAATVLGLALEPARAGAGLAAAAVVAGAAPLAACVGVSGARLPQPASVAASTRPSSMHADLPPRPATRP